MNYRDAGWFSLEPVKARKVTKWHGRHCALWFPKCQNLFPLWAHTELIDPGASPSRDGRLTSPKVRHKSPITNWLRLSLSLKRVTKKSRQLLLRRLLSLSPHVSPITKRADFRRRRRRPLRRLDDNTWMTVKRDGGGS